MTQETFTHSSFDDEDPRPVLMAYGMTYLWKQNGDPLQNPASRPAVYEVNFELFKGEILTLIGPNGSGKSTLLKAVAGILSLKRPGCAGQVKYRGLDLLSLHPANRARLVVYAGSDLTSRFPLTVEEAVMLGRSCRGSGIFQTLTKDDRETVHWAMEQSLCIELRHRTIDRLSGGERQRVALATALAQGAKVLFLDETLSRIDLNHQIVIGTLLKNLAQKGWSIVIVAHDINFATEWADRALCLKDGKKVFEGPIREAISTEKIRTLYPDARLVVGTNPETGTPKVFFCGM